MEFIKSVTSPSKVNVNNVLKQTGELQKEGMLENGSPYCVNGEF
jgi:hypothetical protein